MEALKNAQFVLYCASQFPTVEVEEIKVKPATNDLYWVDVTIKNERDYPTASDRAIKLKKVELDKLTFNSSNNITLIEMPDGETIINPLNRDTRCTMLTEKSAEFRLKGQQALQFRVLVKLNGSNGWVGFTITSQYGGTDSKRLTINVSEQ